MREELFGVERLEQHARSLAAAQGAERKPSRGQPLSKRLASNGTVLLAAYRALAAAVGEGRPVTPSAEWLIDNYHLIEKQIRELRSDLPPNYYRQLPKLLDGPFARYPRVFGLAWAFVAHTDSSFNHDLLVRYVRAYQEIQPLTIGELWAISITLRIVLIENLRRLAEQIVGNRAARQLADEIADQLLAATDCAASALPELLGDDGTRPLSEAFVVQLVHRLRDQDPRVMPALAWLDQRLATTGQTTDSVVRDVHRRQGAVNVSVRNVITSLRAIADADWQVLFERLSLVDDVLAAARSGDLGFRDMDFASRNLYRTAIEVLARGSKRTELEVAQLAIRSASTASTSCPPADRDRHSDPGFHLVAGGLRAFKASIGFRDRWRPWPDLRAPNVNLYAAAVASAAGLILALPLWRIGMRPPASPQAELALLALLGIVPAIDTGVAIVNRLVAAGLGATLLPAMELSDGVPPQYRTVVAVPMLLTTPDAIERQIERLEIHYLASPGGDLHFALLSDWTDAAEERLPVDDALLATATRGIDGLNRRYGPAPGGSRFLLLHRRRVWNEGEACWMGWERKRGKLHELNRLLRNAPDTTFLTIAGVAPPIPAAVRFVITLDADTRLPRDAVHRLIGKLAHPLNRARFDRSLGRVVEGYAVLQPRVTPSLPTGRDGSLFQRIFAGLAGIDPYAAAVSDVYQDLFGEGSYAGKGIYDIDAFEAALANRVPDSTMLSHDLFEGIFARAGLASDVEFVEDFPARYDVAARRLHRWARGDWQLLPWLLGSRSVPAIGRWKMLDNLRRTLSAPMAVAALLAGWTLPFHDALIWTGFLAATIAVPPLIPVVAAMRLQRPGVTLESHLRALSRDLRLALTVSALSLVFLAHQAWLMADAILRTLLRLVTRRHLLEWTTAAQTGLDERLTLAGSYRWMAGAPAVAALAIGVTSSVRPENVLLAAPLAALWLASPAVVRWISVASRIGAPPALAESETAELRRVARRTWRYFETFVTAADSMLPPDNVQEQPAAVIAHRTSPTNIGLYLLSVVSARDFGWIALSEAITRLEATFATLRALERCRGHLFNWYDTADRRPLEPRYVSTVDSGNLAGHLIAVANACEAWQAHAPTLAQRLAGAADAIGLLLEAAARLQDGRRTQTVTWEQLDEAIQSLAKSVQTAATAPGPPAPRLALLAAQADIVGDMARALSIERGDDPDGDITFWAHAASSSLAAHAADLQASQGAATDHHRRLACLAAAARDDALGMDFAFLLVADRQLLSIGYLPAEGTLDPNCYDLLASEARLASFFAIAKGDIPARHWFRLGRSATPVGHGAALISWSGSMFEYLMPSLIMRAPVGSLLEQTSRLVVRRQIDYATSLGLPWGISESAYNARDFEFTYQYSNFGVPGLGLKRGLAENRVIAPYATALATMVDPHAAGANFARLAQQQASGRYGFYEALDYTPARVPDGERVAIVRAFMAHHQGMSIVAFADTVFDGAMRAHFHAEPMIQATELLLQERIPRDVSALRIWAADVKSVAPKDAMAAAGRRYGSAHHPNPVTHLLSNGRFTTMLTAAGSGYSRWGDLAVTRWREDATCDDTGSYIYLRDAATGDAQRGGEIWSPALQPTCVDPDRYSVLFNEDRAEFTRHDGKLATTMDVLVSAEDDAEVRRVSIVNTGPRARELDVTSYAELVLAPQAADIAHPAFSKLFVQTEYLPDVGAILATRRRRAPDEPEIWAAHLSVVEGAATAGRPEIETDRARFLGRGRHPRAPIAITDGRALSNTVGTVLDPIFALRRRVRVEPGATVRIAFWTVVAATREALLAGVDKHRDSTAFARASTLAWTQAQVQLNHLGITAAEAALFQRIAGHVIHAAPALRPPSAIIAAGAGAQSGLWGQGISGDLPIVLLRIADNEHIDVARELLKAHEYWRLKQLGVDLVILNERQSSYIQDLQIGIETLVRASQSAPRLGTGGSQGRVIVLRVDLIPADTHALLLAVARVVLVAQRGSLLDQLDRIADATPTALPPARRPAAAAARPYPPPPQPSAQLEFFNGLGGFGDAGREYVTILGPGLSTPAPWINVIANPGFGFQVATEGSGYTWSVNSREHQITPWSNDPVSDRTGEALYLCDEETGDIWSPTASPIRDDRLTYVARHGRGYSRFEHAARGVSSDLLQFVPLDASVKISRLRLVNRSGRPRSLSLTAYVEWVLAPSRSASLPFVVTEIDPQTGAMFAHNRWQGALGARVAFLDLRGRQTQWTADRREFIGRNGSLASPAALTFPAVLAGAPLSGRTGAGLDPCGAMRTTFELQAGASAEFVILLGDAEDAAGARQLVSDHRSNDLDATLAAVTRHWDDLLGAVTVKTPDRAMDIMLNGWLLYQTVVCRIWARAAFYQASGAYGFRDQLQDGMALSTSQPAMTRQHLLRAAARQFPEGDVQHWWLPHSGQGVRTRISDDRVWLGYTTAQYIAVSGDIAVLDEKLPFLEGPELDQGEHDRFFRPTISESSATLFEHCARGLDAALALGSHGLPLMGTGDWNDGMNRVGERGQGESIWLGWLLHAALAAFIPLAERRAEQARAVAWRDHATALKASLEQHAWDQDWYRRAYFDDGSPLGAAANDECRIDAIAQSWAVLSGAANPARAAQAMASVERHLIRPADDVALLFTPPFDQTAHDPGYIKGYPPGIRENGGQYTHAALWSVMAFAQLGEGDRAHALFALLNPINHARNRAAMLRYKVEPYVVAADVYAVAPHVGRGGWTWYTGSAAWMQRAGIESILGLRIRGEVLSVDPRIPGQWPGFELTIRHHQAHYQITVENPYRVSTGIGAAWLDGADARQLPFELKLQRSGSYHVTLQLAKV